MLAAIPYTTFPDLPLGLRTFGLMVALGVLIGARLGSDYGERFGVHREDTYRTGTLMVLAGIIGSRLTWVATHTEAIDSPVDVIAIWEGGIQFAGGFIAALIVGFPMFRKWTKVQRWHVLNGYCYGLTAGVAIGRIGCYAVGEHFGRTTDFFLGTRYEGGAVREPTLGDVPLVEGMVFHNTALYEFLLLVVLFVLMTAMIWRARRVGHEVLPVTLCAVFMLYAGVERFLLDTLRVNDERFLSMTGAQWMSLVMVPYGLWLYFKTRPEVAKLVGPDGRALAADTGLLAGTEDEADEKVETAPDELAPPDESEPAVPATAGAEASDDEAVTEPSDEEAVTEPSDEEAVTEPSDEGTSTPAAAEAGATDPEGAEAQSAEVGSAESADPAEVQSAESADPEGPEAESAEVGSTEAGSTDAEREPHRASGSAEPEPAEAD